MLKLHRSFYQSLPLAALLVILLGACSQLPVASTQEPAASQPVAQAAEPLPQEPAVPTPEPVVAVNEPDYSGPQYFIPGAIDHLGETGATPAAEANPAAGPTVWEVFRRNLLLDLAAKNDRIRIQRQWYLRHPEYLNRVIRRAEPYLYFILEESIKRGLPSELALLPVVESAYDPFAYSHGRAAGIWQFIPGTGRAFGLHQTWWYEGRRDIVAATRAAMDYLESLNKQFDGDWMLALASYNSGAGTVRSAIRRNRQRGRPTDFWALDLPRETRAYVPKLIAISQIFATPEQYGVQLVDYPYQPFFAIIDTGGQLDLSLAADMAGISIEELYRLNPAFNRWATDPNGPHRLLVPVDKAAAMDEALAQLPPEQRVAWTRYTIQPGDSILSIARNHKITPDLLKEVNHLRSNLIRAGKTLLIPQASQPLSQYSLSAEARLQSRQNRAVTGRQKVTHKVRAGDSFWSIARRYGVSHRALAKWNGMAPTDTLAVGRTLVVWTTEPAVTASSELQQQRMRKIRYRARSGDSYAAIASRFNVSLGQLKRWNDVDFREYLQPGDLLTLYVDVANAP
ncbi:MAG: LysM peptidoglycan-binding domain-containing protein [Pseudomonadota bacterium]|nr:LysM peptidoglycan-binding domain-containing protein [Pseudomonadota bacterium]